MLFLEVLPIYIEYLYIIFNINYSKDILLGIISKLYKIQGTKTTKAITIGSNMIQQNVINWSKRILGKEALAHINMKIITQLLNPKLRP